MTLKFRVRIKYKGHDIAFDFPIFLEAFGLKLQEVETKEGTQNHKCQRSLNMKPPKRIYKIHF